MMRPVWASWGRRRIATSLPRPRFRPDGRGALGQYVVCAGGGGGPKPLQGKCSHVSLDTTELP